MLTELRRQRILSLLKEYEMVTLTELTDSLNVSESTIRRDLQFMEDHGLLLRVHGGAKKVNPLNVEANMNEKSQVNVEGKIAIAKYAASLVQPNEIIYLDAGTTTFQMIPFLPTDVQLKVVTNSVKHAAQLSDYQIETIILGGNVKLSTQASTGVTTSEQLQHYRFDQAFIGINGIDLHAGFTTPDIEEAHLKRIGLKNSARPFILADATKFQTINFVQVAPVHAAEIITDHCPSDIRKRLSLHTTIKEVTL